jgi:hypothetical protein
MSLLSSITLAISSSSGLGLLNGGENAFTNSQAILNKSPTIGRCDNIQEELKPPLSAPIHAFNDIRLPPQLCAAFALVGEIGACERWIQAVELGRS